MALPVDINYLAVLVAAIAGMVVGFVWYHPGVFGTAWMKLSGKTEKDMQKEKSNMPKAMFWAFVSMLVMSCVLAHIVDYLSAKTLAEGAYVAFLIWLGFVATTHLGCVLWDNKPLKLYFLNVLHWLVAMVAMGIILTLWV